MDTKQYLPTHPSWNGRQGQGRHSNQVAQAARPPVAQAPVQAPNLANIAPADISQTVAGYDQLPQDVLTPSDVTEVARLFNICGKELTQVEKNTTEHGKHLAGVTLDKNKVFNKPVVNVPIPRPAPPRSAGAPAGTANNGIEEVTKALVKNQEMMEQGFTAMIGALNTLVDKVNHTPSDQKSDDNKTDG